MNNPRANEQQIQEAINILTQSGYNIEYVQLRGPERENPSQKLPHFNAVDAIKYALDILQKKESHLYHQEQEKQLDNWSAISTLEHLVSIFEGKHYPPSVPAIAPSFDSTTALRYAYLALIEYAKTSEIKKQQEILLASSTLQRLISSIEGTHFKVRFSENVLETLKKWQEQVEE